MKKQLQPKKRLNQDGQLLMTFSTDRSQTVLTDCYQVPPLKASRALYLNPTEPREATVYLMQSAGGLVEGDLNSYAVNLEPGTKVSLVPQAATLVYPAHQNGWSRQKITINLKGDATLKWQPESIIPYANSQFKGLTQIQLARESTLLWGEIISPGRYQRQEIFAYKNFQAQFQVWMEDQCLVYDHLYFAPKEMKLKQIGVLEEYLHIASIWLISEMVNRIEVTELRQQLKELSGLNVGVSVLDKKVLTIRFLSSEMIPLKKELAKIWTYINSKL